jgi:phosphoribosyl 1,2-cyclic phosphate phosphodiesterase
MSLSFTILGCGSSGGVPRIGGDWGLCDPKEQKNQRLRCSLLVESTSPQGVTRVLVDTSPDMRAQMLRADADRLDAVWYTHEHADHTHGIDELRGYFLRQRQRIKVFADAPTLNMLTTRFAYCFVQPAGSDYPPILDPMEIRLGTELSTHGPGGSIMGKPFEVQHGNINALGFRFGNVAYTPDVNAIPDSALPYLEGLDVWIIDALRRSPHPSHLSLSESLEWIARMQPKKAILTNMHNDMDYQTLLTELPQGVVPANDGLKIDSLGNSLES